MDDVVDIRPEVACERRALRRRLQSGRWLYRARKALGILGERNEADVGHPPSEDDLVVVDRFAVPAETRHDHRAYAFTESDHHRAHTGVHDHRPSGANETYKLDEGKERHALRALRPRDRGTRLNDQLLVDREIVDRPQQALERCFVRTDGDEDHE